MKDSKTIDERVLSCTISGCFAESNRLYANVIKAEEELRKYRHDNIIPRQEQVLSKVYISALTYTALGGIVVPALYFYASIKGIPIKDLTVKEFVTIFFSTQSAAALAFEGYGLRLSRIDDDNNHRGEK